MPRPRNRPGHAGGLRAGTYNVVSITDSDSPYTMTEDVEVVLADATAGVITVNLPAVATSTELFYTVKKTDGGANVVTVDTPGAETIDGSANVGLAAQYSTVAVVSDSANWHIISEI